jgi:hypothetical protein
VSGRPLPEGPLVAGAAAGRAPVGATPSVQQRLLRQRPRPLLVRLYATLASDVGALGPAARRRGLRLVTRSVPAAVTVAVGALVVLRAFEGGAFSWPQGLAVAALAARPEACSWWPPTRLPRARRRPWASRRCSRWSTW